MLITTELCRPKTYPLALTIGNFDGVHIGHQAILKFLHTLAPQTAVLTFANHPQEILSGSSKSKICTLQHKYHLLREHSIDWLYLIPFTKALSQLSARDFLTWVKKETGFTHLVLGHDAVLGHNRKGTPEVLHSLARSLDFTLTYIDPVLITSYPVSSTRLRSAIQKNSVDLPKLLGRPYSIRQKVTPGAGKGRLLGFKTANLELHELTLPPYGVYLVESKWQDIKLKGVANLGKAPTLHKNRSPTLEAHFFDFSQNLYDQELEIRLLKRLREEKTFATTQDLKNQIEKDCQIAKSHFN